MSLVRVGFAVLLLTAVVVLPTAYYRTQYNATKRLRPVEEGKLYRCGLLTASGFADAVDRFQIKTVINLREEAEDPMLSNGRRESEWMAKQGVRFIHIPIDLTDPRIEPSPRPQAIDRFLAIMDDPANHPVLLHCQAGLHRTGIFTAIYRMEYQGWSLTAAMREMKENGFQERAAHDSNVYIKQYLIHYQTRAQIRQTAAAHVPSW